MRAFAPALCACLLGVIFAGGVAAQNRDDAVTALEPVTVTATRVATPASEIPASLNSVEVDHTGLGASLAEALQEVPGLSVRDRQNYAQDAQLSIRGFGTRSAFGIRGVRLYADGIPATQPDGQGQISQFNLATADRVEVLRGPFSALYGNSSGGVIQLFTMDAPALPDVTLSGFGGAYGDQRLSLVGRGYGVIAGLTHFKTEGYRDHSAARRLSFNAKADHAFASGGSLTLLVNHLDAPDAQDPLGLTRAQFESNPKQTATAATQFDTRKSLRQTQLGLIYQREASRDGLLRLMIYGGEREVGQFLAIPVAAQSNPRHAGGVVDLGNRYGGADSRYLYRQPNFTVVGGLSADLLRQHRQGFENFSGSTLGVQGAQRRDEINSASALDQYAQFDWTVAPQWSLLGGVRHSVVRFESSDRYIRNGNPDDSGKVHYEALTPVAGLLWRQNPQLHWYASYGTGFETPTFAELAYRADGRDGLNFDLDASRTRNAEAGLKWHPLPRTHVEATVFRIEARDELVTATNAGGRATYSNAARTRREGSELQMKTALSPTLDLALAYTWLDATVRSAYGTCVAVPCTTSQAVVPRGSLLPGVAQGQFYSRLSYAPLLPWQLAAEFRYLDAVPVNDVNTEFAPSYGVVDGESSYRTRWGSQSLKLSLRIENLLDAQYAGSVIVNDGNGRYYEPARGRSFVAGVELAFRP